MPSSPAVEEFGRLVSGLREHRLLAPLIKRGEVRLGALTLAEVAELLREDAAYYFLLAATGLNRTSLKRAASDETAKIVSKPLRKAFAVRERLPVRKQFADVESSAVALRRGDLDRRARGGIEALFRERLRAEGIPLLMSPPVRQVPGILIGKRKPDGVFPDPALGKAPRIFLEIKNLRRVSDDIQKRLYEIAEASLEMKLLYGSLELQGLGVKTTSEVLERSSELRARLRRQTSKSLPVVIVLFLCSAVEGERYRAGAEAFVDHVFFQEEIEDCLALLKHLVAESPSPDR